MLGEVHVGELPALERLGVAGLEPPALLLEADTENQYFSSTIPDRTSIRSNSGQLRRNSWCSSSVQKPITHSTFERLYQLRSNSTISPAAGRCSTYRWKYHWVRSRSVGLGSATTRTCAGWCAR